MFGSFESISLLLPSLSFVASGEEENKEDVVERWMAMNEIGEIKGL